MSGLLALVLVAVALWAPYLAVRSCWAGWPTGMDVVAAPAASVLLLAWCGVALELLGLRFSPLSASVLLATACGVVLAVRALRSSRARRHADDGAAPGPAPAARPSVSQRRIVILALLGVSCLLGALVVMPHGGLGVVPSSWDGVWHGYLSAVIERGGRAAPWVLTPLDPQLSLPTTPYPYGFHLVIGLVAPAVGVPAGYNGLVVLGASLVGVTGVAAAARELFPRSAAALVTAPFVLVLLASWQVRIQGIPPYALGIALIPGGIALFLHMVRRGWDVRSTVPFVLACGGMVVIQPAALISLVVVLLPLVAVLLWRGIRPGAEGSRLPWLRVLRAGALIAVVSAPWLVQSLDAAGATLAVLRPTYTTLGGALLDGLLLRDAALVSTPLPLGIAVLASVAVLGVLGPHRWLIASWVLVLALYVIAAGGSDGLRSELTGVWFTDWPRLSAVLAVVAALVVAGAVSGVAERLPARASGVAAWALAAAGAVAVALAVPTYRDPAIQPPQLVTSDELAAFAWLGHQVEPGDRVLNIWRDGSTWAYALEGVPVANPYGASIARIPGRSYLMTHMRRMGSDPKVDAELVRLQARWAIVDPTAVKPKPDATTWFPADSPYATLVFESGRTLIYRIDLEGLASTPAP